MDIPINYIIHDTRIGTEFKGITISGFKRKDVINAFQNSIINNKLEDAIRWCVELHSTGLNNVIWNSFNNVYLKYIHINNPKLFFYLNKRYKEYNNIIKHFPKKHEIFSRNNQEIRNLFAELTSILTLTKKNNIFLPKSLPSIKNTSFEVYEIKKRMISKNMDNILDYIHNTTSNDTKLALNEIMNNIQKSKGTFQNCLYWYLWLEKYQSKMKKPKNILFENVNLDKDEQYYDHWAFILWKIIMSFENRLDKNNTFFLRKLEYYYKVDFKLNSINKKKFYFFIAFYILKHNISWNVPIFQQEYLIIQTNANINSMYYSIIQTIESKLSDDTKKLLKKNYNKMYITLVNKEANKPVKKVKDMYLENDINKVVFTEHPEYYDIKNNKYSTTLSDTDVIQNSHKLLISKNKNKKDVIDEHENKKNKKLEAFTQFITYKNNQQENSYKKDKSLSVVDYYKNNEEKIIDNITYSNDNNDYGKHDHFEIIKT